MDKFIIDRFEGEFAVCEGKDKSFHPILKLQLPTDAKEGDCIIKDSMGKFMIDQEETRARKQRIRSKLNKLFE
ncbi:MAG: hypothetical protein K0S47_229 [Herbinix sp.]|jgi:hypothetical protein|nr:hypothetical protein [Herbinix sp.]